MAFTLVELLLVMAMLTVVIALAAPTLSRFFRGRSLDLEAGRFLGLTRYAQSQAVSTGTPMILWVQRVEGTYGLRPESQFQPRLAGLSGIVDSEPTLNPAAEEILLEYELGKDLRFEIEAQEGLTNQLATIRFSPDGSIDETSLRTLRIVDQDGVSLPISLARGGSKYALREYNDERTLTRW